MPTDSIPVVPVSSPDHAERVRARLSLLGQLEASLNRSRKALLALDLAGIERGTAEQVCVIRELGAFLQLGTILPGSGLEEDLRRSESRILQTARLQAALLVRARSKLRILGNMLAGPSSSYGPITARNGGLPTRVESRRRF
jgi:hypothetical protein